MFKFLKSELSKIDLEKVSRASQSEFSFRLRKSNNSQIINAVTSPISSPTFTFASPPIVTTSIRYALTSAVMINTTMSLVNFRVPNPEQGCHSRLVHMYDPPALSNGEASATASNQVNLSQDPKPIAFLPTLD